MKQCPFNIKEKDVIVAKLYKKCRYHRACDQKIRLAPDNLCLSAYQKVYSYCLALLYNAKLPSPLKIHCPNPKNYIEMEIIKSPILPKSLTLLKRKLEVAICKIYRPLDLPDHNIFIKIISQKGDCPKNYQIGKTFKFNLYDQKEICPAGFYQLYPFLKDNSYKNQLVSCPDEKAVVYQIK